MPISYYNNKNLDTIFTDIVKKAILSYLKDFPNYHIKTIWENLLILEAIQESMFLSLIKESEEFLEKKTNFLDRLLIIEATVFFLNFVCFCLFMSFSAIVLFYFKKGILKEVNVSVDKEKENNFFLLRKILIFDLFLFIFLNIFIFLFLYNKIGLLNVSLFLSFIINFILLVIIHTLICLCIYFQRKPRITFDVFWLQFNKSTIFFIVPKDKLVLLKTV